MENLLFLGVPKLKHVTVIENVLELNVHYFTDSNFLLVICSHIIGLKKINNRIVLLFYVHGKHLRSCRDGQLT